MRTLLIPALAFTLMGANKEAEFKALQPEPPTRAEEPGKALKPLLKGKGVAALKGRTVALTPQQGTACSDRLDRAQDEERIIAPNLPLFQRRPNTPEKPLAIYAVDRRENGCGVMVMMGNPNDVRPVPSIDADEHRLMPADALKGELGVQPSG